MSTVDQLVEAFAGRGRPMPDGLGDLVQSHEAELAAIMADQDISPDARFRKLQERIGATDTVLAALLEVRTKDVSREFDDQEGQLRNSLKVAPIGASLSTTPDERHRDMLRRLDATQRTMSLQMQLADIGLVDDGDELLAIVADAELLDDAPSQRAILRAAQRRADQLFVAVPETANKPMHPLAATAATLRAKWSAFAQTHLTPAQRLAAIAEGRRGAAMLVRGDFDFAKQLIQIKSREPLSRAEAALRGRVRADADFGREAQRQVSGRG